MSKFDWDRRGPPRPGSSSVDHPRGVERPYVHLSEKEKKQRREDRAKDREERAKAIRDAEWQTRFGTPCPY